MEKSRNLLKLTVVSYVMLFVFFFQSRAAAQELWAGPGFSIYPSMAPDGSFLSIETIPEFAVNGYAPFNVYFSSKLITSQGILGNGWRIPVFEAGCYKLDETQYIAELPNGRKITFNKIQDHTFISHASSWKGIAEQSRFTIRNLDAEEVIYEAGKIVSFTHDKVAYRIERNHDSHSIISEKKTIFQLRSNKKDNVQLSTLHDSIGETIVQFDTSFALHGSAEIANLQRISTRSELKKISLLFDQTNSPIGLLLDERKIEWNNLNNGHLLSDGIFSYTVRNADEELFDVSCQNTESNHLKSYYRNAKTGIIMPLPQNLWVNFGGWSPRSGGSLLKVVHNGPIREWVCNSSEKRTVVGNFLFLAICQEG